MAETNLRSLGEYQKIYKRRMSAPKGYQIVNIKRDGQCLYNAITEEMIHKQLAIPSARLTLNSWERGQHMRYILIKLCKNGYQFSTRYARSEKFLL